MASDIKLDGEKVIVEGEINGPGNQIKFTAHDLLLDNPDRRGFNHDPHPRLALLHDANDRLTINGGGFYDGVTVWGPKQQSKLELLPSSVVLEGGGSPLATVIVLRAPVISMETESIYLALRNRPSYSASTGQGEAFTPNDKDELVINKNDDFTGGVVICGETKINRLSGPDNQLKITAYDLLLDNPTRRQQGSNPQGMRRALVHDTGDTLTLNYGKDYPGGVVIHGQVQMDGPIDFNHGVSFKRPIDSHMDVNGNVGIGGSLFVGDTEANAHRDTACIEINKRTILFRWTAWENNTEVEHRLDLVDELKQLRTELQENVYNRLKVKNGITVDSGIGTQGKPNYQLELKEDKILVKKSQRAPSLGQRPTNIEEELDLVAEVRALRQEVNELRREIEELKNRH